MWYRLKSSVVRSFWACCVKRGSLRSVRRQALWLSVCWLFAASKPTIRIYHRIHFFLPCNQLCDVFMRAVENAYEKLVDIKGALSGLHRPPALLKPPARLSKLLPRLWRHSSYRRIIAANISLRNAANSHWLCNFSWQRLWAKPGCPSSTKKGLAPTPSAIWGAAPCFRCFSRVWWNVLLLLAVSRGKHHAMRFLVWL